MVARMDMPPRARAGRVGRGHRFAVYPRCSTPYRVAMVCVYCQKATADTDDHVIPEGFFDQPPDSGYIKVPACYSCNNGHSRDEECFLVVVLGEATLESESANKVLERIGADHASGRRKRTGLA